MKDKSIKIVLCDGTTLDLGNKNKLTNVNYTGGDTGGGNATVSYSYTTYNKFTYLGPNEANASYSSDGGTPIGFEDVVEDNLGFLGQ